MSHFVKKDSTVHFEGNIWKMKRRIVESIFAIGMSPFLMNVCACAIVIVINNSLQEHGGDMAIGAYGIINRLLTLYVMIVLGLTMGMQPIVGYNFGAQKIDRVKQTLKLGIISGVVITICAPTNGNISTVNRRPSTASPINSSLSVKTADTA